MLQNVLLLISTYHISYFSDSSLVKNITKPEKAQMWVYKIMKDMENSPYQKHLETGTGR